EPGHDHAADTVGRRGDVVDERATLRVPAGGGGKVVLEGAVGADVLDVEAGSGLGAQEHRPDAAAGVIEGRVLDGALEDWKRGQRHAFGHGDLSRGRRGESKDAEHESGEQVSHATSTSSVAFCRVSASDSSDNRSPTMFEPRRPSGRRAERKRSCFGPEFRRVSRRLPPPRAPGYGALPFHATDPRFPGGRMSLREKAEIVDADGL